jgi:EAL domain-containing protein (putative c-di-GMP-specific phosphodiesterase class I)
MFSRFLSRRRNRASDRAVAPVAVRRDARLADAIRLGRIAVHFQPQIEPSTGRVVGVEALARWRDCNPAQGLFARAAAGRLSERLSRAVQRRAIRAAAAWDGVLAELRLSINVLPEDLARADYDRWLLAELAAAGLDPRRLTIEIVESGLVRDRPAVAARLQALRDAGVRIAVDDFGTGYANLAYLTSLPLDSLKIDRGLVADLVGGCRDRIVVKAMISMARELGLSVIVEGVETPAQLALVAAWGCDLYQGFLGAGALDEDQLGRFVAATNSALAA